MANPSTNSVVISRTDSGFPDYLDFAALRSSSIEYLSGLTGKVWTDYNVHDPGITILEMLIYALLDLGYRTNLPVEDIFARNPADTTKDNNFFTPSQILTCNPLTITDFRKMLIDIDGVKNAWLTIAEDIKLDNLCSTANTIVAESVNNITPCSTYINGLYHITIQLDDTLAETKEDVINNVKEALLSQRNLCEDFIDIAVLYSLNIGICADIGLEPGASAEDVYINIVKVLENFFTPAPQFYTLQQLLDKNKKIEDIFAGRPYNLSTSHGFADTEELDRIMLKTEIHLSDVYNVLLDIDGVATVKKLKLTQNGKDFFNQWQFIIPTGYATVFSTAFSSVQFSVNGIVVPEDYQKISTAVKAVSHNSNKLIRPAVNIDLTVPAGTYHNDLADYYSIQNEFPLNYGIGPGGLPKDATPQRQAQALQLKGYLLFFDQLLANYLSQLGNVRNLFSFKLNGDAANQRTYFLNELKNVPDFAKLILNVTDESGASAAIKNNSALGYPVLKKDFEKLIQQGSFSSSDLRKIQQAFTCNTLNEYSTVAGMLQNNFSNGDLYQVSSAIATTDNSVFYYVDFLAEDIIITGELYATTADALRAINLVPAMGEIGDNYKSFSAGNGTVSFTIQLNQLTYAGYLSQVIENKTSFKVRRDGFLNHLLARFAEQFTDYALLSYGFLDEDQLSGGVIKNKEDFLTQYPLLSSSRGKAFDYRSSAKDNISGFEKRFKSYAGIESSSCDSLCNFEVVQYQNTYSVQLHLAGFDLLNTTGTYEGPSSAQEAVQSIFSSLSAIEKYRIEFIQHDAKYQLLVSFNNNSDAAYYPELFNSKENAENVAASLQKMFDTTQADNIIVSQHQYRLELQDSNGKTIRVSIAPFDTEAAAFDSAITYLRAPEEVTKWQIVSPENKPSGKFCSNDKKKPEQLIDIEAFKIDINNNIAGKPDKFNYELLDKNNLFHFRVLNEFTTKKQAYADAYGLLMLMVDKDNYHFSTDKKKKLFIHRNGQPVAECLSKIETGKGEEFIDKVCGILNNHYYKLYATPFACRWKFNYPLGFEKNTDLLFVSDDEFDKLENAENASRQFNKLLQNITLEIVDAKYSLRTADNTTSSLTCTHVGSLIEALNETDKLNTAKQLLELRKEINKHNQSSTPVTFEKCITIDDLSKTGAWVYRLIDKDNVRAQHSIASGEDGDKALNILYSNALKGYSILSICLGGDITASYKDVKTKLLLYRYIIRCHYDFGPFKKDTILFESSTGYASVQEAENAFNNNYLFILNKAMDAVNYGPDKYIRLGDPKSIDSNSDKKNEAVVFIPKETQVLAGANEADIIKTLTETSKAYPVRVLIKCSDDYKKQYPAEAESCLPVSNSDCKTTADGYVYFFALHNSQTASDDWQSAVFYNTPQDARQAFYFFMILLQYKGNYFIDKDYNNQDAVFIREVLAESKSRFTSEPEAWGSAGIEKFICIAQTEDSFHSNVNKKNCSYAFTVACNTANGIHPCKYDSAAKRDEVLEQLYASFKNFDGSNLFKIVKDGETELLYGVDGNKLAIINSKNARDRSDCDRIIELLQAAGNDKNYIPKDNKLTLKSGGEELASPYDDTISQPAWKKLLLTLAFYYPIQLINEKYCIEIRLPGFNAADNIEIKKPYGCGPAPVKNAEDCYVAWQGACCFDSCTEAFANYETLLGVLDNYANYRAYFGCVCYSYGIALQSENDIAAFNPQNYSSTEMACDAVERSKKLVNREGIYLAEHILLRPRIQNDCACDYVRPGNFLKETKCSDLFWKEEVFVKGIQEGKNICFAPGEDPFSFIATVVLPAWPERFRKEENRDLLEMMLYRETPAHILLRILWLNPWDTCKFETPYKMWKTALLKKETGDIETTSCNLMKFLFGTTLSCLSDCLDCLPCTEKAVVVTCLDEPEVTTKAITANDKLNAINDLFGWNEMNCSNLESVTENAIDTIPVAIADIPVDVAMGSLNKLAEPVIVPAITTSPIPAVELTQDEARFFHSRKTFYKQNIDRIYAESNKNLLAKDAGNILTGTGNNPLGGTKNLIAQKDPAEEINRLIAELLSNNKTNNKLQGLTVQQKEVLIKNLLWFYLDKSVFEEKNIAAINLISAGLNKLRENNFDMQSLFTEWKPEEIARYEPTATIDEIYAMIVKNKL